MVKQSEDGTDNLYRNVGNHQCSLRYIPEERKVTFTEVTNVASH